MIKTIRTLFPTQSPIIFILFLFASNFLLAQPVNDEPCNAIEIPVGTSCVLTSGTNEGATETDSIKTVPNPKCTNLTNTSTGAEVFDVYKDVWFKAIVPPTGSFAVKLQAGGMTDSGLAFYTGTCDNLTLLSCDNNTIGFMSQITQAEITPGITIWIRVWSAYNGVMGSFDICAVELPKPPKRPACDQNSVKAADSCENAPRICSVDAYCGNTSSDYSPTFNWSKLSQELSVFNMELQNDSYVKFVPSSPTVVFDVWVTSSSMNRGIQMVVFTSSGCGSNDLTIFNLSYLIPAQSAPTPVYINNLTPGVNYYILIDGYGGDVCNYTIGLPKNSGIEIPVTVKPVTDTICLGNSIQLTAKGGNDSFDWSESTFPQELVSENVNNDTVVATPTSTGVRKYKAKSNSISTTECPSEATITVKAKPTATLLKDTAICLGEPLTLEVKNVHYGEFIDSLIWNTGDTTKFLKIKETGNYTATLYSFCEPSGLSLPSYVDVRDCSVEVPNVITPNGDGANDYFTFIGEKDIFITFKVVIVNRWGNSIYEITDPQNGKWDGKDKSGNMVPDGVYFYTLKGMTIDKKEVDRQGFIQVLGQ